MKVIVAETAGFCRGVRDALETTLNVQRRASSGETIYTLGPLIHNRQVLSMLADKGIEEAPGIAACGGRKVIIRAHGIPPEQRRQLKAVGAEIIDATCKRVARVQAVIKRHARQGYETIVVGDQDHAEVVGLMGFTEGRGHVVQTAEQLEALPKDWRQALLVAQTTQNQDVFERIEQVFRLRYPRGEVIHTICGATHERQNEVRRLCAQVDAMVIVGGYHSGNTVRLAEVARECRVPTYHVETEQELDPRRMSGYRTVGVSAGASTPNWMIRNVVRFLESVQPDQPRRNRQPPLLDWIAYSNVSAGIAAALLVPTLAALCRLSATFTDALMAGCYVFGMHIVNRYLDRASMQLNDPRQAAFYRRHLAILLPCSLTALTLSLWAAARRGLPTVLLLALLTVWGGLYNVPILQHLWRRPLLTILKIKDIPTSKTLGVPLAWATVTALVPHLDAFGQRPARVLIAWATAFLLVLVRTALLDFRDVLGDRLVGRETIVVYWGEPKTARLLKIILTLLAVFLLAFAWWGTVSPFAVFLLPAVGAYAVLLGSPRRHRLRTTPTAEITTDSVLAAAGLPALVWLLFGS